jgi:(E)-4-hydroxy-3-methylbut-2-enyl-diphosphate synthase
VLNQVREATKHLVGLDIAVMGCIVNGPGEMADADYGYVGAAGGKITLYRKREPVKHGIPQERGVEELIALLKEDHLWEEPPAGASTRTPLTVKP